MAKKAKAFTFDFAQQDAAFAAAAAQVAAETGHDSLLSFDEVIKSTAGLQLPCLAMEYICGANIWPFGRVCEIFGRPHASKSAFVLEVLRWNLRSFGFGAVIENENKDASSLAAGMLSPAEWQRVRQHPTNSINQWQEAITFWTRQWDANMPYIEVINAKGKKVRRPYFYVPLCLVLDSLTATTTDESIEKIDSVGSAGRSYPDEARDISKYLKTMPSKLRGRPYTFIFTNHYKPSKTSQGIVQHNVPGGEAGKFAATHRFFLTKMGGADSPDGSGSRKIRIKVLKSCLGPENRKMDVVLKWAPDKAADGSRTGLQKIWWDWDEATINLLLSFKKDRKTAWDDVMDIVDLHEAKGGKMWSKRLGVGEGDAVKRPEMGRILESNMDVVNQLRKALMIATHGVFIGNDVVPYGQFIEECIAGASMEHKLASSVPRPYAVDFDADVAAALTDLVETSGDVTDVDPDEGADLGD